MKTAQELTVLSLMHNAKPSERGQVLETALSSFGLSGEELVQEKQRIQALYDQGISKLNREQLNRLMELDGDAGQINRSLDNFGVHNPFRDNILVFLQIAGKAKQKVDVEAIDEEFEGVQVVTEDSFEEIISKGYTADWIITPENVQPLRIQIASKNKTGKYKRGWYINADISHFEEVFWEGQKRQRVFIKNPQIINSGNTNVKFKRNPVTYIKKEQH